MNKDHKIISLPHFLTLFTLAVSQPIFDILGKNIEFFIFRSSNFGEVILITFTLGLIAPLLLFGVVRLLSHINYRLGSVLYAALVTLFFILFYLLVTKYIGVQNNVLLLGMSLVLGVTSTVFYYRKENFFSLIGYMVIVVILAPSLFLWNYHLTLTGDGGFQSRPVTVSKNDIPVFILVFDELPLAGLLNSDGDINEQRFPNFAHFAATSTWYKNASTVADSTPLAIAALLTGKKPAPNKAGAEVKPTAAKYPGNLFSMLRHTHNIHASETITSLCSEDICSPNKEHSVSGFAKLGSTAEDFLVIYLHLVLPDKYRTHLPSISSTWGGFQLTSKGFNFAGLFYNQKKVNASIADMKSASSNDVHYLHINMPHHPWINYPSGKRYFKNYTTDKSRPLGIDWFFPNGHLWGFDEDALATARQRQQMQIGFSDKILGQFLDAIEHSDNYDNALVMVLSDHGSSIAQGQIFRFATEKNAINLLSVPLMVKYPGQVDPKTSYLNAEITDILPTITDVLEIDHSWKFDGYSLRKLDEKTATKKSIMRTIISTATNKEIPYLITVDDTNLFDKIVEGGSLSSPSQRDASYIFDDSYTKDWLGVSTDSLSKIDSAREASIPQLDRFENINLSRGLLAGFLRISIPKKAADEALVVALALNGKIHATRYVNSKNPGMFDAILPESAFVNGKNIFELYIVDDSSSPVVFEKLVLREHLEK